MYQLKFDQRSGATRNDPANAVSRRYDRDSTFHNPGNWLSSLSKAAATVSVSDVESQQGRQPRRKEGLDVGDRKQGLEPPKDALEYTSASCSL